jgi:hypothetical protein
MKNNVEVLQGGVMEVWDDWHDDKGSSWLFSARSGLNGRLRSSRN